MPERGKSNSNPALAVVHRTARKARHQDRVKMEEIPFPSMSFEQLFPSLARSQSSQDTYTADLSPGLADADPGKTFPSLCAVPDKHNEVEADHNEDETDLAHVEPTSLRNTAAMEMETDDAKSMEKTTSPEAESAEGSPYSVDLRVITWMQQSKFIVHTHRFYFAHAWNFA